MIRLPAIWLVFAVIVVDLTGFGIVIPILPFISPALGGDELDVALVIAVYSLCAGIVGPFWGSLSDRLGRKRVLMICLFGGAVSYAFLGLASELWMVYAARAFGGIMAGSLPVSSALMADLSPPERRAKAMGLVGTAFGMGLILGPLLGGLLAGDGQSFMLAGLFAGSLSLLSVLLAQVLLPNDHPHALAARSEDKSEDKSEDRFEDPSEDNVAGQVEDFSVSPGSMIEVAEVPPGEGPSSAAEAREPSKPAGSTKHSLLDFIRGSGSELLVLQYALHTFAVSSAIYLSPLWLAALLDWGPREIGILFGLVGVVMIVIQGALLDWLTHRFGLINVLSVGALVFALSLIATTLVEGTYPRAFAIFMLFSGATCCLPVLNTIASGVVPHAQRGRMMGVTTLASAFGRVAGPLFTGLVLAAAGYSLAWLFMALPVFMVLLWSRTAAQRYVGVDHTVNANDNDNENEN